MIAVDISTYFLISAVITDARPSYNYTKVEANLNNKK